MGGPAKTLSTKELELYAYPCAVPILELAQLPGFEADPRWIRSRLRFRASLREITEALEHLIARKLLRPAGSTLERRHPQLRTKSTAPKTVRTYHRAMLRLAEDALDALPVEQRNVTSLTVPLDMKSYRSLCRRIAEFREELQREYGDPGASRRQEVYFLGFALVPITKSGLKS